jgi:single-stranded-DNA-specific exonuclease
MPDLQRRWMIAPPVAAAEELARALRISPLVANLLCQRGQTTPELAQNFLEPKLQSLGDPFALSQLRKSAERLKLALERKERIVIYGDYDVDGITSSALLWRVLKALGGVVETFLPQRLAEGYGLSQEGIERCVEEYHPQVLVAVDCGTTSPHEVEWLMGKGIEVLIMDHHTLPEVLPKCHAMVNPQQDGHHEYLASVGVVFKLCHGLLKLFPDTDRRVDLREYLDLVAVGTVADLVPLQDDNRIFVRRGLAQLAQTRNPGLRALCMVSQIKGVPTPQDVGFRIGPRLNASGRMGDAILSLQILKTEDFSEAQGIARELDVSNRDRQNLEQAIFEEAQVEVDLKFDPQQDRAIVVGKRGWHIGVIGIVASRLQRRYYRPTIVIGFGEDGMGKGSGRSIEGCSIVDGLRVNEQFLLGCGGHAMAAGLTMREENLEAFRVAFNGWAKGELAEDQLQPTLSIASELEIGEVSTALFEEISMLAPFGQKNPEPIFAFRGVRPTSGINHFGRNHVKFSLRNGQGDFEAVAFGFGDRAVPAIPFIMAGTLDWDDYKGRIQLRLMDWKTEAENGLL